MRKDLYTRHTDALRNISEIEGLSPNFKEKLDQIIETRNKYYQENKQYVRKNPPKNSSV